jgi:hypothetical protein
VQCAEASQTVPKGRSAWAKQNLHRSNHFIFIGLVFYQFLVLSLFFNLAGNGSLSKNLFRLPEVLLNIVDLIDY